MNDVFGPIWRSQESASDFRLRRTAEPNTSFIKLMSLLPGLEIETRYSLQRNTVCFNRDINFHFFPSIANFLVEFGCEYAR